MIIFDKFLEFITGLSNIEFVLYFGMFFVVLGLNLLFMRLAARW